MNVQCPYCGTHNNVPVESASIQYQCHQCRTFLPKTQFQPGDTSEVVGLIGGAMLGAAIFGPVGAIIGGVVGAVFGKERKGLG